MGWRDNKGVVVAVKASLLRESPNMIMVRTMTVVKVAVRIQKAWVEGDPGFPGCEGTCSRSWTCPFESQRRNRIRDGRLSPPPFTATVGSTGDLRARECISLASSVRTKNQSVIHVVPGSAASERWMSFCLNCEGSYWVDRFVQHGVRPRWNARRYIDPK